MAPPLRILCFGASLVEGHTARGTRFTPYSARLREILKEINADVEVETDGKSGDLLTSGFEERMAARCEWAFSAFLSH